MSDSHKSSAELEREIAARRLRIENKVDQLTARLSPGQLIDEALRYTRNGPAADFASNLGRSVVNNPVPIALIGASLAWLVAKPEGTASSRPPRSPMDDLDAYDLDYLEAEAYDRDGDEMVEEYPVAAIRGAYLTRVGVEPDGEGRSHASFADETGRKFHALADSAGNRAGHFKDEAGRMFRGFIGETGHRITDFRDETGNRLAKASGWASHAWEGAEDRAARMRRNLRESSRQVRRQARNASENIRAGGEQAVGAVDDFIHRQPLVSGAIAFALGAVLAGALPHTRQEDEAFGETADDLRDQATSEAASLYEKGRDEAGALYEQARDTASEWHDKARDAVAQGHDAARAEADKLTRH